MTEHPTSTFGAVLPGTPEGDEAIRSSRRHYRITLVVLAALVASAALDGLTDASIWGVSSKWVGAEGGGYELDVRYPDVSRPALSSPFDIVVHRAGGFDGPVEIAVDPGWLEMWDYQALWPEASSMTATPERVVWTFEAPDGDVLRVFLDGRIQPPEQSGRDGWVAVLDPSGAPAARVEFTTAVRP